MRNLILSALLLASAFQTAFGQTYYVSGNYTYTLLNNEATIVLGYASGAVTIPSTLNSYPVVSIGDYAFSDGEVNYAITSLIIPNGVRSIGSWAFWNSYGIVNLTIPSSVTTIEQGAFYGCTALTSVTIPNGVTSIGEQAFYYCTSLTYVTIPSSVTSIGEQAFAGCTALRSVDIPSSVTSIGEQAFLGCENLSSVTIANGVTSIGEQAFEFCFFYPTYPPSSLTIPNSVTSIGKDAFSGCIGLSYVFLPSRFETTYQDFGLTSAQAIFYDSTSTSYLAGQQSVINNPSAHNLYTATQHTANFNAGKDSVLNSPNSNGLYTANQMQAMAFGDLVLTKNANGSFTLNYDIEQSADLQTWTTYAPLSLPLTGLPTDKAFVRIKAKQ